MDFWNTVLGNRLASILCSTLPKIANNTPKQIIIATTATEIAETLAYYIDARNYYLQQTIQADDKIYLIFIERM